METIHDTRLIDGKATAASVRRATAEQSAAYRETHGRAPGLATVLVGDDPASEVYVRNKRRQAVEAGLVDIHRRLAATVTTDAVVATVTELAADPAVSGILVQLPLPLGIDASAVIDAIPWHKDVDGLTTTSAGLLSRALPGLRPCTPSGVLTLLDAYDVQLAGADVAIIGRSELVGRPLAQMLTARDATVTTIHSRTRDRATLTRRADVVVVAAGSPGLIGREDVRPGSTVIDVGIHRVNGKLTGDTRFRELVGHAGLLTPVPGGVGPMTIAELLRNTVAAAYLTDAG
ncbi:bifunctional 5,10-methylenetetrahydrofolate dehydrogenase/5,10-methenyltetrahydrofolate cyclohydrolase [Streptomyces sp. NPDC057257]|uniref:bifunctional 5,10-methylenetetrahydrofolate dehydrogenase/5,10-methenyltetrahydrofolate cyclohydrolase n=1 Tax=Streptomyces sp. NPDC057257 TaxID=3346071 RepID=UPI00363B6461